MTQMTQPRLCHSLTTTLLTHLSQRMNRALLLLSRSLSPFRPHAVTIELIQITCARGHRRVHEFACT